MTQTLILAVMFMRGCPDLLSADCGRDAKDTDRTLTAISGRFGFRVSGLGFRVQGL